MALLFAQSVTVSAQTVTPDKPIPFGFKTQWMAIKTNDVQYVIQQLPSVKIEQTNWEQGLDTIYHFRGNAKTCPVFVSPVIQGWVLIIGDCFTDFSNIRAFDDFTAPLLAKFADVQYFGSHRVVDYFAWAKAENGQWIRRFAFYQGDIALNDGAQTEAEKQLGLLDIRSNADWDIEQWLESADEETPALIAERWSINPLHLPFADDKADLGVMVWIENL